MQPTLTQHADRIVCLREGFAGIGYLLGVLLRRLVENLPLIGRRNAGQWFGGLPFGHGRRVCELRGVHFSKNLLDGFVRQIRTRCNESSHSIGRIVDAPLNLVEAGDLLGRFGGV